MGKNRKKSENQIKPLKKMEKLENIEIKTIN